MMLPRLIKRHFQFGAVPSIPPRVTQRQLHQVRRMIGSQFGTLLSALARPLVDAVVEVAPRNLQATSNVQQESAEGLHIRASCCTVDPANLQFRSIRSMVPHFEVEKEAYKPLQLSLEKESKGSHSNHRHTT